VSGVEGVDGVDGVKGADGADGADGVDGVDGDRTEGMRWWEQSRSNAHTAQTGQRWTWTLALSTNCR